jgi:hypothetical protein
VKRVVRLSHPHRKQIRKNKKAQFSINLMLKDGIEKKMM